ncbi:hypothetical protein V2W45_1465739 [Cenococcum geophilum]
MLSTSASTLGDLAIEPLALEDPKTKAISRASRLEYKTYKIAKPVALIGEKTKDSTFYVDIKFKGLQDVLRKVLKDIRGICLREDKPLNLLYNFLPELEFFIKTTYTSITKRLKPLLKNHKITYNLLWALFKPNSEVYTTYPGISKPRCVKFNYGKEKIRLNCRYFNFNRKVFREAALRLAIKNEIRARLIRYRTAFYKDKDGNKIKVSIKSRIIQINPNYARPQINNSPTVLGFSLVKFADSYPTLNNFVLGKGRGLITLLYGLPSISKTLIIEAMLEYLIRPLYVIRLYSLIIAVLSNRVDLC